MEHRTNTREFDRGRMNAAKDLMSPSELGRRPEWEVFPTTWAASSESYRLGYTHRYNQ